MPAFPLPRLFDALSGANRTVQSITPRRTFEDVVLPPSTRRTLDQALAHVTSHDLIFNRWGLGQRHPVHVGSGVLESVGDLGEFEERRERIHGRNLTFWAERAYGALGGLEGSHKEAPASRIVHRSDDTSRIGSARPPMGPGGPFAGRPPTVRGPFGEHRSQMPVRARPPVFVSGSSR